MFEQGNLLTHNSND